VFLDCLPENNPERVELMGICQDLGCFRPGWKAGIHGLMELKSCAKDREFLNPVILALIGYCLQNKREFFEEASRKPFTSEPV
jgi:hypothetical protein